MTNQSLDTYRMTASTIHILAKIYKDNSTIKFGILDFNTDEELQETLVGSQKPRIVLVKNGKIYKQDPLMHSYDKVYEFIEGGYL